MHLSKINEDEKKESEKLKKQKDELNTFLESWKKVIKEENIRTTKDAIIKSKNHRKKIEERIEKMTSQNQFKKTL